MNRSTLVVLSMLMLSLASSFKTSDRAFYSFDDKNIYYSPWNWSIERSCALSINPGAYFKTIFTGKSCILQFDISKMNGIATQLSYRVSGGSWVNSDIKTSIRIDVPGTTSSWAYHLLEVRIKSSTEKENRWDGTLTAVKFIGLLLEPEGHLMPPPVSAKTVIFFGDSITEGVRTLNAENTNQNDADHNDAGLTWDCALAERIGAEYGIIGFGASGLSRIGSGEVPMLATSMNYLYKDVRRKFTAVDLVVFNEGTNDGKNDITKAFTSVLNQLDSTKSVSRIIVLRPFNGPAQADHLQNAIKASEVSRITSYIDTKDLGPIDSNDGLHPNGNANLLQIAPKLFPVFNKILNSAQ